MKRPIFHSTWLLVVAGTLMSRAATPIPPAPVEMASTNNPSTNAIGPRIQFASPVYDFGKVVAGEVVKCDFVFTNTGDELLEISGVYPGCGCTAAGNWTRQVEPGKTGLIPLQFNSAHFANQTVTKTATVASNDKRQPTTMLQIKGTVWKPIDVNPQTVIMTIVPDAPSNAAAVVRIVSSLDEPISLFDPFSNNRAFAVEVKTNQPGKQFELVVQPVPPFSQGTIQGNVSVKTSYTNLPVINVTVIANVQPALVVMPPQIMLPAVFPSNALPYAVSIRNNSSSPLSLSEPAINAKGAAVQVKEVVPGRQFTVTVTFPPGFEATPGENLELTVKTSHPQYPMIKVPVRQQPMRPRMMPPPMKVPPSPTVPATPSGVRAIPQ